MSKLSRKIADSYSGEALFQGVPNVQGLPGGHVGECDDEIASVHFILPLGSC